MQPIVRNDTGRAGARARDAQRTFEDGAIAEGADGRTGDRRDDPASRRYDKWGGGDTRGVTRWGQETRCYWGRGTRTFRHGRGTCDDGMRAR